MKYEVLIGLEFHVQLKTRSKMFCRCLNESRLAKPNANICPICLGHPGTLPVINKEAVHFAQKAALALNCTINKYTKFDRKNYFYPDLPKGYQISQYDEPLAERGYLDINYKAADGLAARLDNSDEIKRIRITRVHMEEDSGKSIHRAHDNATLLDFNRGGAPLIEIVTEPDMSTPSEAKTFGQELQLLVRRLGVSQADMERGELRCDANISLRPAGEKKLYTKTEIKNINSFHSLERALEFELKRQTILWEEGQPPKKQETRGFDDKKQVTVLQRSKEDSADYRYFPEPDLPPLTFSSGAIEKVRAELPELPQARRQRFITTFDLAPEDAKLLTSTSVIADYFEALLSELENLCQDKSEKFWDKNSDALTKLASNWLINNLLPLVSDLENDQPFKMVTAENFAELILLILDNKLNSTNAVKVLKLMVETGADPDHIIVENNLGQVNDDAAIEKIVTQVLAAFPSQVADYCAGKEPLLQFLVGQVMRESRGSANPQMAETMIKKLLKK